MLKPVYESLGKFASHRNEVVASDTLRYQVPGGMLSNFRTQLQEQGMADKFEAVFAEIPVVRKALGWIPLVTPTSQIVGVQACLLYTSAASSRRFKASWPPCTSMIST